MDRPKFSTIETCDFDHLNVANYCKLLQLLQPPENSRQHFKSGFQHRKLRRERGVYNIHKKTPARRKDKIVHCKMLRLQSALNRLFRQTWDHFHWKERARIARVESFFDFVAHCCKCCKMLQSLIAGCKCRN